MASRYLVSGGSSTAWSNTSNWSATDGGASGASAPTASDDVYINSNSGNAPIALTSGACLSLTVSGTYTGTISGSGSFTSSGSITFIAGINYTATSTIIFNNTATITSAGKTISALTLQTNGTTYTFADDLTISGTYTNTGNNLVLLGSTIYLGGNMVLSNGTSASSTTKFVCNGTTTQSGNGVLSNDLEIAGTFTGGTTLAYRTGTLKYTSGTFTPPTTLLLSGSCTLDTSSVTWTNITANAAMTATLASALNFSTSGTFTLPAFNFTFVGAHNVTGGALTNTALTVGRTNTFVSGQTYSFTTISLSGGGTSIPMTLKSSTTSSAAYINGSAINSQTASYVIATDIDSSGGQTIRDRNIRPQDLTRTVNWNCDSAMFYEFFN